MAISSKHLVMLAIFVIAVLSISCNNLAWGQCQGDLAALAAQCTIYIQKLVPEVEPSKGCCDIVKKVDIPCVCKHILKEIEKFISMEKVLYVAQSCGKPLGHGTKCGSYTVP